jgi:hypothetical protein
MVTYRFIRWSTQNVLGRVHSAMAIMSLSSTQVSSRRKDGDEAGWSADLELNR